MVKKTVKKRERSIMMKKNLKKIASQKTSIKFSSFKKAS